jgi:D-inositol-3-phosphate glycosyltransferase
MMRVVHLTDDPALGGVNRWLDAQLPRLGKALMHERLSVDPRQGFAPALASEAVVVHFTMSWRKLPWLAALRARNIGSQLILVEHSYTRDFESLHVPHIGRFRTLLRATYALVDQVVAVSENQSRWFAEALGLPERKFQVINPLTDIQPLRALPLPMRGKEPLRLCGFGRYAPQKGFDDLIAAMRLVSPDLATLRLVGLGPSREALVGMAADLPHVSVEGPVSGPLNLFPEVDAIVVPSRFEPYGCVAAEARAAGRPMIVTTVDGLNDHPVGAPELRVPRSDPASLASAIRWLASQDVTALGARARQSVDGAEDQTTQAWYALFHGARKGAAGLTDIRASTRAFPTRRILKDALS